MSDQILERFHRALIEEIQTQRPEYLVGAFSVAEIYQHLVPYGSHRDRIGVEMNGDYEDALIRLLAGEGGYLILDSEPALRDLRAELETPHPNTGLYREFAAVDVRLNQAYLDLSSATIAQLPDLVRELEAEDPVAMAALAPSEGNADLGIVPPGVDIFGEGPGEPMAEVPVSAVDGTTQDVGATLDETPPVAARPPLAPEFVDEPSSSAPAVEVEAVHGGCHQCGGALPERDQLNFCPFCGTDLTVVRCGSCGVELETGWRFCPSCGSEAET
jgi:RNA polymerase subunit RPABC4/transcription elongation factor Spt4